MAQGYEVTNENGERAWWDGKKITLLDDRGVKLDGVNAPTEGQRTTGFLSSRIADSAKGLRDIERKNPNASKPGFLETAADAATRGTATNLFRDADRQKTVINQLDILDAALTMGTGAAYTQEQLKNYQLTYFPSYLDKPENVAEKRRKLGSLLRAAKIKGGAASPPILDEAIAMYGADAAPAGGTRNVGGRVPPSGFGTRLTSSQRTAAGSLPRTTAASGLQSNPYVPTTDDEFENLPVGSFFINPADGRILKKRQ
jgi:hypothetical protein